MEAEKKQQIRKSFKGSVLFTILVVMLVVLLLMVTTIGLAHNASKRAYSEFFDHQTTNTARSVVDSVIYSMQSDNQALGVDIVTKLQSNHETPVRVQVNGGNDLGEGFGTVNDLVFTYVAEDGPGGYNITGSGKPIIKITATVTQGGVTSTYSQYCIGETKSDNKTSSGGGLVALGGFEGEAQPGVDAHSPAYFGVKNKFTYDKLVTLSNPNSGALNALIANSSAEVKTNVPFSLGRKEGVSIMGNLFLNDGEAYFHANFNDTISKESQDKIDAQIAYIITEFKKQGILTDAQCNDLFDYTKDDNEIQEWLKKLLKDDQGHEDWSKINSALDARKNVAEFRNITYAYDGLLGYYDELKDGKISNSLENPYLYVGGTLYLYNRLNAGFYGAPMNIFCGRIVAEHVGTIRGNANIYCYNKGSNSKSYDQTDLKAFAENPWSKLGTTQMSQLLSWADQNSNFSSYQKTDFDTGSFATMGSLELTKCVSIARDLYVDGDLLVNDVLDTSSIGGNVYVKGTITDTGKMLEKIVKGTVYNGDTFDSNNLPSNVNRFLNGDMRLNELKTTTIKTADSVKGQFYKKDKDGNEYFKDAVNKSLLSVNNTTKVYMDVNDGGPVVKSYTVADLANFDTNTYAFSGVSGTKETGGHIEVKDPDDIDKGFNYGVKITESCILAGNFNQTIYIEPTAEICINLHNFSLSNGADIIVNDLHKVNFFIPATEPEDINSPEKTDVLVDETCVDNYKKLYKKVNKELYYPVKETVTYNNAFTTNSATKVITLDYYKHLIQDTKIDLVTYPTADSDPANNWKLPKIGIYASENGKVNITLTNNIILTGDICAPGADFYSKSGNYAFGNAELYYEGKKIESGSIGCIGSIIVDKIKEFNNDFGMAYVDDPSTSKPSVGGGLQYEWTPIDGYAFY